MRNILFASDLDNTLIFSYKHRRETDVCVELLEGKEQGFCTQKSLELLARVREQALFIPVTSRSVEQYRRIHWPPSCVPRYAVTTNGGILLDNGTVDTEWHARSQELTAPWQKELLELEHRLPEVPIEKRFRIVDGLYLFTACNDQESAQTVGRFFQGETTLDVEVSGRKVYFFPEPLNKGSAVLRLQERFFPERTICAGDSTIDVPMLLIANTAIIPNNELLKGINRWVHDDIGRFPDFVLETVLKEINS